MGNYLDKTGLTYFWGKLKNYFQPKLVSGTNIKTINSQSLLGSGNINIQGGGGGGDLPIPTYYGVCSTAAATAAKEVTVDSGFSLSVDSIVIVQFTYRNTAKQTTTLNVNSTGAGYMQKGSGNMCAKAVYIGDELSGDAYPWNSGSVLAFFHVANSNRYDLIGGYTPAESVDIALMQTDVIATINYDKPHYYMDLMYSGDTKLTLTVESNSHVWSITVVYVSENDALETPIPFTWEYNIGDGEITVTIDTPIADDDTVKVCVLMNPQP